MCWLSDGRKVGQHHFKSAELQRCCSTTFFVLFYNGCISHTDAAGLTYCISLFLIRFFSVFPSTSKSQSSTALLHTLTAMLQHHQPTNSRVPWPKGETQTCMPGGCLTDLGQLAQLLLLPEQPLGLGWWSGPSQAEMRKCMFCSEEGDVQLWSSVKHTAVRRGEHLPSCSFGSPVSIAPQLDARSPAPAALSAHLPAAASQLPFSPRSVLNTRQYFLEEWIIWYLSLTPRPVGAVPSSWSPWTCRNL